MGFVTATVLLLLSVTALVSGYQGDKDQDAYLETLLTRLLDLKARGGAELSRVDDLVARKFEIDSEVVDAYRSLKYSQRYSWIILKIQANRLVVEDKKKSSYDDFVDRLKASGEPRYAVFTPPNEWGRIRRDTVFILWIPSGSTKGELYRSYKYMSKTKMNGIDREIELVNTNGDIMEKIKQALG